MTLISFSQSVPEATIIDMKNRFTNPFKLVNKSTPYILVYNQGTRIKICVNDIILIKASSNYSYIVLDNHKSIFTSKTIKHWANEFNSETLLRIHKTYLINKDKVIEINKALNKLTLTETHTASYSRRMKKELFDLYKSQNI